MNVLASLSVGQKRLLRAVYFELSFSAGNCVSFVSAIKQEIEYTESYDADGEERPKLQF